jgi:hypothetical protein
MKLGHCIKNENEDTKSFQSDTYLVYVTSRVWQDSLHYFKNKNVQWDGGNKTQGGYSRIWDNTQITVKGMRALSI